MSSWQNAISRVLSFVNEYDLIAPEDRILVGLSGGPDSVLLTEILHEISERLHLDCHIAHVNYRLRGADSDADQELAEEIAANKKWPISVLGLEPDEFKGDGNFQDWARRRRYEFFSKVAGEKGAGKIAVAHHLTDQIETMFLRLLRGSGLTGIASMRPSTVLYGQTVIRPLLPLTREEIISALGEYKLPFREDKTNLSKEYRRNRLRHEILPLLSEIQPGYEHQVGEALLLMQGDDEYLEAVAGCELERAILGKTGEISMSRAHLRSIPRNLRLRVLRQATAQLTEGVQGITFHHIKKGEGLVCGESDDAAYDMPGGVCFEVGPLTVRIRLK